MFITTGMKSEICPGNLEIRPTGVRDVLPLNWCKLKVLQVAPQKKKCVHDHESPVSVVFVNLEELH